MAIYDYVCSECKKRFEKIVPRDERDSVKCFSCGAKAERLITFVGTVYAPTAGGMK